MLSLFKILDLKELQSLLQVDCLKSFVIRIFIVLAEDTFVVYAVNLNFNSRKYIPSGWRIQ